LGSFSTLIKSLQFQFPSTPAAWWQKWIKNGICLDWKPS
jgi:hypothetical protein